MSEGLNMVSLLGNLGAEPELKQGPKGPVLKLRLATDHSWKNKETNAIETRTEWHSLTMFGTRAEKVAQYLHKGSRVMVTGHLRTSSYEKEGQKHFRTEVIVDDLYFFSSGRPTNGAYVPAARAPAIASSDLPF